MNYGHNVYSVQTLLNDSLDVNEIDNNNLEMLIGIEHPSKHTKSKKKIEILSYNSKVKLTFQNLLFRISLII